MSEAPTFATRWPMPTRWADNDHYGHVNNVTYYSYFDTAVNAWLMSATGMDTRDLPAIGVVAETSCRFLRQISFPDQLEVGIACERLGNRSVVYQLAVFRLGEAEPAALGRFVHVYVDEQTRQPVPVPEPIRAAVEGLLSPGTS
ncbi:acyl-CoA thioesterase [Segniliparus rugosus]|uniref:YbgC/YbaW family acyl-CoA thioester hydrolase n=1 Tax=Segniliparus rugosus (strain ATCC BAA-974 / DSM 45345 / CCUG 50838 / CIP 108380 / JCM 13579 / CDC 945) TaxID=679197 RepID=E5XQX1_SEGRC|nr:thioesterase family protein [Segniliparus rugosus]EFV13262.1 YbgC/YbaW family acyl-CoA thioester hydrolase [Segniliparus rugosus ATCC BAA-974]